MQQRPEHPLCEPSQASPSSSSSSPSSSSSSSASATSPSSASIAAARRARRENKEEERRQTLSPQWVHERTGRRIEYFELQQLSRLEKKERDAIRDQIGKEVRDKCRAELDDYYDCMVDRSLTFLACKRYAKVLHRCVKRYEQPELVGKRWTEIAEERERLGLDGIRRHNRKQYNKYVTDADGTGWLPRRKPSSHEDNTSERPPRS